MNYRIPSLEAGLNHTYDLVCQSGMALPVGPQPLAKETRASELTPLLSRDF